MSNTVLTIAEKIKKYNAALLSPTARSSPAHKLYARVTPTNTTIR